jgi:hypothetical protein
MAEECISWLADFLAIGMDDNWYLVPVLSDTKLPVVMSLR